MENFNDVAPGRKPQLTDYERESRCEKLFRESGPFWHLFTPENFPVFLSDPSAFQVAMNAFALCAKLHPEVRTLTFEWMTNHLHGIHCCHESALIPFFEELVQLTEKGLKDIGRPTDLSGLQLKKREITSLSDLRTGITYTNRNGYLVSPAHTPFTYPWGANRFYFNYDAKRRFRDAATAPGLRERRTLLHTKRADPFTDLKMMDGHICPLCFCDIAFGESMFRDAHQYFASVSRNVESHKSVAVDLGESVFYTDDELVSAIRSLSSKLFDQPNPTLAPKDAKIQLAKTMRFDYNASNKQIIRILRLDATTVNTLFPNR